MTRPVPPIRAALVAALRRSTGEYNDAAVLREQAAGCIEAMENLLKAVQRELEASGNVSEETAHAIDLALQEKA